MFEFKTKPYPHQERVWGETKDVKNFGVFWEQGTGKTKLAIDTAAWLVDKKEIDSMLVVAPSGVQANWIYDELPIHMSESVRLKSHSFSTIKKDSLEHKQGLYDVIGHKGFSVLAMSYDAFMTPKGKQAVWDFMRKRKDLLYILDESARIKNPKAKRTKAILKSSMFGKYKRVLTGTPIANGPFDIYSPLEFLDPEFWKHHRFPNYFVFEHYFGNIVKCVTNSGREFPVLRNYRNVQELYTIVQSIASRVTKAEVLKDLPPKIYTKSYFEMSEQQNKIYQELKDDKMTILEDEVISVPLVIVQMLRLQQVTSGYLPSTLDPDGLRLMPIPGPNPRLELLKERCEDIDTQGIIWARFRMDIDLIIEALGESNCARYDGKVTENDRWLAKKEFKAGKRKWFVATTAMGGEGLTLNEAKNVIYYSNSFKLTDRLQSEDRPHRIGQTDSVLYDDLIAVNTMDMKIVESLRRKLNIADIIMGDCRKEWI